MSARDEAIKAAARSIVETLDGDFDALDGAWASEWASCAADALDTAMPVLLAPLRRLHRRNELADLPPNDPGRAVFNCDEVCVDCLDEWPCATVRLLDQIEGGESR